MTFPRGAFVTANLVPRGRRNLGRVAGEPYPVAHFAARRLVRTRMQAIARGAQLKADSVPKGPWVTIHFYDLGYHEVPVTWLRSAEPPKPEDTTPKRKKKRK